MLANEIDEIAGDAYEGYNPTHDVCRLIIQTAVQMVSRQRPAKIANYDFSLNGDPKSVSCLQDQTFELDDNTFQRKIAAARSYQGLESEVNRTLEETPLEAFRVECLRLIEDFHIDPIPRVKPYYETHGEKQVKAGLYRHVIRLQEHILPLSAVLRSTAELTN